MTDMSTPAAGWYADPENPAGERWWNGSGWSDHRRDATTTDAAAATAATAATASTPEYSAPDPSPVPTATPYTVPEPAGFTYGNPNATPRPDPYAPPAPAAQPYYGGAPSSPYVAPYGAPAPGQGVNGLALAGLLVGAIGWIIAGGLAGIAGLVLSILGLNQAKKREAAGHPQPGRGLAIGGIVASGIVLLMSVVLVIAYLGLIATSGDF